MEKQSTIVPRQYPGMKVFQRIQEHRAEHGLTIAEVCEKMNWHSQQFYALNTPERFVRRRTLIHIMQSLDIPTEDFFTNFAKETKAKDVENIMKHYPSPVLQWLANKPIQRLIMAAYYSCHK